MFFAGKTAHFGKIEANKGQIRGKRAMSHKITAKASGFGVSVLLSYHEIEAAPADFGEAPDTFITLHPSPARRIGQPALKSRLAT